MADQQSAHLRRSIIAARQPICKAGHVAAEVIASWADTGSRYLADRGLSETDARTATYALLTALESGFL